MSVFLSSAHPIKKQIFFFQLLLAFGGLFLGMQNAAAQTTVPSNLQVVGTITAANSITPSVNDLVKVVLVASLGTVIAQGTVIASDGTFLVDMSKTQDFNGTNLTILLAHGGALYQLNSGSTAVAFPYSGTFPFPSRIAFTLSVGTRVSGGGSGGNGGDGGGGSVQNAQFDVNDDGVFNQTDINAIKGALGNSSPASTMDVNNDGVVNTRDVIDAIRALNSAQARGPHPAVNATTTTTTPTTTP
jgi:hypothetical protein